MTAAVWAQTPPAPAASLRVSGTVVAVDAASKHVSIKSDKGEDISVETTERTVVLRIPAGETDVNKATKIAVSDLTAGDRVVAVSKQPIQGKVVAASSILVMSKADVAKTRELDQEDWKKRGTTGTVASVDPVSKAITLKVGVRTVTVQPSPKTEYHRYSLDSARFSDAKPSSFAEVKVDDELRALGNKNEDGATVQAERIVFGTFRQIAATIVSIDAAAGEMKVADLTKKKGDPPITIRVNADSDMKKLSPELAQMLARRYSPAAQAAAAQGGDGQGRGRGPGGGAGGPGGPGARGGRGGRGGDIGQMLTTLPPMPIAELKPKDAIMVRTTLGSDPTRVTVTQLLAGVEPLLTASPTATRDIMSGWNLGGGGGGEGN